MCHCDWGRLLPTDTPVITVYGHNHIEFGIVNNAALCSGSFGFSTNQVHQCAKHLGFRECSTFLLSIFRKRMNILTLTCSPDSYFVCCLRLSKVPPNHRFSTIFLSLYLSCPNSVLLCLCSCCSSSFCFLCQGCVQTNFFYRHAIVQPRALSFQTHLVRTAEIKWDSPGPPSCTNRLQATALSATQCVHQLFRPAPTFARVVGGRQY